MIHLIKKNSFCIFGAGNGGSQTVQVVMPPPPVPPTVNLYPAVLTPPLVGQSNYINSFSYAEMVDLISDGPIEGLVNNNGTKVYDENIFEAIFLNETPIKQTSLIKKYSVEIPVIKDALKKFWKDNQILPEDINGISKTLTPADFLNNPFFENSTVKIKSYHPSYSLYNFAENTQKNFNLTALAQRSFDSIATNESPFLSIIEIDEFKGYLPMTSFSKTEEDGGDYPFTLNVNNLGDHIYFTIGYDNLNSFSLIEMPRTFLWNNELSTKQKPTVKKSYISMNVENGFFTYKFSNIKIFIWSIYDFNYGIKNFDKVLDKYFNYIGFDQKSSSLYNYNFVKSEFKNGSETQSQLNTFKNIEIDTQYSKELIGPFKLCNSEGMYAATYSADSSQGGPTRLSTFECFSQACLGGKINTGVCNESSDDIRYVKSWSIEYNKTGEPYILQNVRFNYAVFDQNSASRTCQEAVPITHYIENNNVEDVYVTLDLRSLYDTAHVDLASDNNLEGTKSLNSNSTYVCTPTYYQLITNKCISRTASSEFNQNKFIIATKINHLINWKKIFPYYEPQTSSPVYGLSDIFAPGRISQANFISSVDPNTYPFIHNLIVCNASRIAIENGYYCLNKLGDIVIVGLNAHFLDESPDFFESNAIDRRNQNYIGCYLKFDILENFLNNFVVKKGNDVFGAISNGVGKALSSKYALTDITKVVFYGISSSSQDSINDFKSKIARFNNGKLIGNTSLADFKGYVLPTYIQKEQNKLSFPNTDVRFCATPQIHVSTNDLCYYNNTNIYLYNSTFNKASEKSKFNDLRYFDLDLAISYYLKSNINLNVQDINTTDIQAVSYVPNDPAEIIKSNSIISSLSAVSQVSDWKNFSNVKSLFQGTTANVPAIGSQVKSVLNTPIQIPAGTKLPASLSIEIETGYETDEFNPYISPYDYNKYQYDIYGMNTSSSSLIDIGRRCYDFLVGKKLTNPISKYIDKFSLFKYKKTFYIFKISEGSIYNAADYYISESRNFDLIINLFDPQIASAHNEYLNETNPDIVADSIQALQTTINPGQANEEQVFGLWTSVKFGNSITSYKDYIKNAAAATLPAKFHLKLSTTIKNSIFDKDYLDLESSLQELKNLNIAPKNSKYVDIAAKSSPLYPQLNSLNKDTYLIKYKNSSNVPNQAKDTWIQIFSFEVNMYENTYVDKTVITDSYSTFAVYWEEGSRRMMGDALRRAGATFVHFPIATKLYSEDAMGWVLNDNAGGRLFVDKNKLNCSLAFGLLGLSSYAPKNLYIDFYLVQLNDNTTVGSSTIGGCYQNLSDATAFENVENCPTYTFTGCSDLLISSASRATRYANFNNTLRSPATFLQSQQNSSNTSLSTFGLAKPSDANFYYASDCQKKHFKHLGIRGESDAQRFDCIYPKRMQLEFGIVAPETFHDNLITICHDKFDIINNKGQFFCYLTWIDIGADFILSSEYKTYISKNLVLYDSYFLGQSLYTVPRMELLLVGGTNLTQWYQAATATAKPNLPTIRWDYHNWGGVGLPPSYPYPAFSSPWGCCILQSWNDFSCYGKHLGSFITKVNGKYDLTKNDRSKCFPYVSCNPADCVFVAWNPLDWKKRLDCINQRFPSYSVIANGAENSTSPNNWPNLTKNIGNRNEDLLNFIPFGATYDEQLSTFKRCCLDNTALCCTNKNPYPSCFLPKDSITLECLNQYASFFKTPQNTQVDTNCIYEIFKRLGFPIGQGVQACVGDPGTTHPIFSEKESQINSSDGARHSYIQYNLSTIKRSHAFTVKNVNQGGLGFTTNSIPVTSSISLIAKFWVLKNNATKCTYVIFPHFTKQNSYKELADGNIISTINLSCFICDFNGMNMRLNYSGVFSNQSSVRYDFYINNDLNNFYAGNTGTYILKNDQILNSELNQISCEIYNSKIVGPQFYCIVPGVNEFKAQVNSSLNWQCSLPEGMVYWNNFGNRVDGIGTSYYDYDFCSDRTVASIKCPNCNIRIIGTCSIYNDKEEELPETVERILKSSLLSSEALPSDLFFTDRQFRPYFYKNWITKNSAACFSPKAGAILNKSALVTNSNEWEFQYYIQKYLGENALSQDFSILYYETPISNIDNASNTNVNADTGISIKIPPPRVDKNGKNVRRFIRIKKLSYETLSSLIQKTVFLSKVTEIIPQSFSYPFSALVSTKIDSRSFSSIPTRTFACKLKKVLVPSNYFPLDGVTNEDVRYNSEKIGKVKIYDGDWDGTFKLNWTDNPAWILMDMLISKRYGLGNYIESDQVDIWELYKIARWCDGVDIDGYYYGVPDSYGGVEPRHTFNGVIGEKFNVFDMINQIASIFRGHVYYMNSLITFDDDRPKPPIGEFTNLDVKDGLFNYTNFKKDEEFTAVEVAFVDAKNNYKPSVEYVEDSDAIRKRGILKKQVNAFGITSRGQARRFGKHFLYGTSKENLNVTFVTDTKALLYKPGDLVTIHDELISSNKNFGSVKLIEEIPNSGHLFKVVVDKILDTGIYRADQITLYTPIAKPKYEDMQALIRKYPLELIFSGIGPFISGIHDQVKKLPSTTTAYQFLPAGNPLTQPATDPSLIAYLNQNVTTASEYIAHGENLICIPDISLSTFYRMDGQNNTNYYSGTICAQINVIDIGRRTAFNRICVDTKKSLTLYYPLFLCCVQNETFYSEEKYKEHWQLSTGAAFTDYVELDFTDTYLKEIDYVNNKHCFEALKTGAYFQYSGKNSFNQSVYLKSYFNPQSFYFNTASASVVPPFYSESTKHKDAINYHNSQLSASQSNVALYNLKLNECKAYVDNVSLTQDFKATKIKITQSGITGSSISYSDIIENDRPSIEAFFICEYKNCTTFDDYSNVLNQYSELVLSKRSENGYTKDSVKDGLNNLQVGSYYSLSIIDRETPIFKIFSITENYINEYNILATQYRCEKFNEVEENIQTDLLENTFNSLYYYDSMRNQSETTVNRLKSPVISSLEVIKDLSNKKFIKVSWDWSSFSEDYKDVKYRLYFQSPSKQTSNFEIVLTYNEAWNTQENIFTYYYGESALQREIGTYKISIEAIYEKNSIYKYSPATHRSLTIMEY